MATSFNRALVNDSTPQLGGNLDLNTHSIAFPTSTISDAITSTTLTGAANTTLASSLAIKTYVDDGLALKIDSTEKGAANGVATLGADGKIPSAQIPALALTEVFVVADITARDALTVQEGDVAKVTDASADPAVTSGSASYIYDGAAWVRLNVDDQVLSVNGQSGSVVLDADDIDDTSTTNKFATAAQLAKIDFITVTQAVDLDTMESDIALNNASRHDAVTLNADTPTQDTLNLVGQELQVNLATTTTHGAMSASDKSKLDGIEAGATADQSAAEVPYTNTTSGLTATDVQAAIDEVEGRLDTAESNIAAMTDSNQVDINQTTHGLAVGDLVYISGANTVTKSQANSAANAEVNGIVTAVADANNFTMAVNGVQTLSGATLTAGSDYFLDPTTAGAYTTTEPSGTGQVSKPCFRALTTTQIVFAPQRGITLD